MRCSTHLPAPPLSDFVQVFWHCAEAPPHSRARILPCGTIEILVNLRDDEIRVYDSRRPEHFQRFPGIVVSGAYAGAFDIDPSQRAFMMGVHFRPGGAFPFFGFAVGELAGVHLGLEALWGSSAVELRERLCAAQAPQKRFQILDETLRIRLRLFSQHPAVSQALDMFGPAGIGDSVGAVAERIGLSQRRFIQVFTAQVGLTPKLFCRVLRFKHAREFIDEARTPDWRQVAQACGYCDQSHLIHDFQEFSGLRPTDYLCLPDNRLARNHVRLLG